ncbi:replication stress response regulator SDE2 [Dendroctonus ponderosae]|uniref:SDE2-like domain-containing protein n=1 Tax=Dendroctonus ponderosae TaxID=77166 RepID=U4UKU6_DENPD|nr:replication stress response regulator SDE2 [Dendroctonus ponderosae]ERL93737.1 hypothetical protein D910_11023 [Dendroctonus ponderosae]KAH1015485.1 hypothetical protein HUJ05_013201 [Dendroctonus ponderosae]
MELFVGKRCVSLIEYGTSVQDLVLHIQKGIGLRPNEYYLTSNGRIFNPEADEMPQRKVHIILRTLGGKGGFGSMLRAIGAQIEKTTNREACRDLNGRRLRDINEEQRLIKWVEQQGEREIEAEEKKKKKLEKLLEQPRHEFKDEQYEKEMSELTDKIEDAVTKGLEASTRGIKRKIDTKSKLGKKPKLWIDSDIDEDLSTTDSEDDDEGNPSISVICVSPSSSSVDPK